MRTSFYFSRTLRDFCHVQIYESNFESIYPIWQNHLWPGRSAIESYSWMKMGGGHYSFFEAQKNFWTVQVGEKIIGVLSAHTLPDTALVRIRGLWVNEHYRRKRIASRLIEEAIVWAKTQGAEALWTYPRQEAWVVYEKCGFQQEGPWLKDEKGQMHCYASKII